MKFPSQQKPVVKRKTLAGLMLLGALCTGQAMAAPADLTSQKMFAEPTGVSAKEAAGLARDRVGGKLISIKPNRKQGGYNVRLLVEGGRVVKVSVDPSGRIRTP